MVAFLLLSGCLIDQDTYDRRLAELLAEDSGGPDTDGPDDTGCARVNVWVDADGDGYGNPDYPDSRCAPFDGWVENSEDCDDANGDVFPGAVELCATEADDDCDDQINEAGAPDGLELYGDADGDGYGAGAGAIVCLGAGWVADATDCDDGAAGVNPGAEEVCGTGVDEDCDEGTSCRLEGEVSVEGADVVWEGDGADFGGPTAMGDLDGDGGDEVAILTTSAVYIWGDPGDGAVSVSDATRAVTNNEVGYDFFRSSHVDLDGDGVNELVVVSFGDALIGPSRIYWADPPVSGASPVLDASSIISGDATDRSLGFHLAPADDLTGDGLSELMISDLAPAGESLVHVVQAIGGSLSIEGTDASITGNGQDAFGYSTAAGDANGDGTEDLVVHAPAGESGRGLIYIFHGPVLGNLGFDAADTWITGAVVDDNLGLTISCSPFLDADGDGDNDLLVPAWGASQEASEGGAVYLFAGPLGGHLEVDEAVGAYFGAHAGAGMGWTVDGGDVDGDGRDDLLLGASPPDSNDTTGRSYLVYGPGTGTFLESELPLAFTPAAGGGRLGGASLVAGDVDADGLQDLLLLDGGADQVYLFRGRGL